MIHPYKDGDQLQYEHTVTEQDLASFASGNVHPVYATFSVARDAEWCCRLFVLEMKEADEEGIGTFIEVEHVSPAYLGSKVSFTATLENQEKNNVICRFEAKVGDRVIARGRQGQKILKRERLEQLFNSISE
jgi:fluoroacetyl-CoA thioesterase